MTKRHNLKTITMTNILDLDLFTILHPQVPDTVLLAWRWLPTAECLRLNPASGLTSHKLFIWNFFKRFLPFYIHKRKVIFFQNGLAYWNGRAPDVVRRTDTQRWVCRCRGVATRTSRPRRRRARPVASVVRRVQYIELLRQDLTSKQ